MEIDSVRNEYNFPGISKNNMDKNPYRQFKTWMKDALNSDEKEPTAMALSTIGTDGYPKSRIVLLKFFDERGFVFYTNYNSEKGKAIENKPFVGLHVFWATFERQICITGIAEKTSREESEKYFKTRPLESRIAAWASEQSREIPSRNYLEDQYAEFIRKFHNQEPPVPAFWGGYRVIPHRIEFWQGRANRLHDRILYEKKDGEWLIKRLSP
jgi:pyridoxamine 5'-phosphate oxidase